MGNMKMAILNFFANEVVVKCNMFHTGVEHRVLEARFFQTIPTVKFVLSSEISKNFRF